MGRNPQKGPEITFKDLRKTFQEFHKYIVTLLDYLLTIALLLKRFLILRRINKNYLKTV